MQDYKILLTWEAIRDIADVAEYWKAILSNNPFYTYPD